MAVNFVSKGFIFQKGYGWLMEFLYFTIAGLLLYVAADWVLLRIEAMYGKMLPNRSLYFFGIIMAMSLILFEVIQRYAPESPPPATGEPVVAAPVNPVNPGSPEQIPAPPGVNTQSSGQNQ